jgi:hypothetical protein
MGKEVNKNNRKGFNEIRITERRYIKGRGIQSTATEKRMRKRNKGRKVSDREEVRAGWRSERREEVKEENKGLLPLVYVSSASGGVSELH